MENKVAYYRKRAKLKQYELADKLGFANKKMNSIEHDDFDLRKLKLIELGLICEALNIKLSDLIDMEQYEK